MVSEIQNSKQTERNQMPELKQSPEPSKALSHAFIVSTLNGWRIFKQVAPGLLVHHKGERYNNDPFEITLCWDTSLWPVTNTGRKVAAEEQYRQLTMVIRTIEEVEGLLRELFEKEGEPLQRWSKWKTLTIDEVQLRIHDPNSM